MIERKFQFSFHLASCFNVFIHCLPRLHIELHIFIFLVGDENSDRAQDTHDSGFPNVPTAVSLIAQEAAAEDVCNECDPEMAKVYVCIFFFV